MVNEEILVISNDTAVIGGLRRILVNAGMSMLEARSVNQALMMSRKHAPHLMIIHVSMPPAEVSLFLQRRDLVFTLKGIPVVLVGHSSEQAALPKQMKSLPFLMTPLASKNVLLQVKTCLQDRVPIRVKFDPNDSDAAATGTIAATLCQFNEAGFAVRSRARLRENFAFQLPAPLLSKLGYDQCLLVNRWVDAPVDDDQYTNRVQAFGMGRELAEKMRKALETLKSQNRGNPT